MMLFPSSSSSSSFFLLLLVFLTTVSVAAEKLKDDDNNSGSSSSSYGVDCSMPMHNLEDFFDPVYQRKNCGDYFSGGERQILYRQFMKGCRDKFGWPCDRTENQRIDQMLQQPRSLFNYTEKGYDKIKAPPAMMKLIMDHWERNKDRSEDPKGIEKWIKGHTYVNQWEKNTTLYSMVDYHFGGTYNTQQTLFKLAKPILEEWTGMELQSTSLYGIRVYHEGAILMPHVDRNPLICSAIINVAQDPQMKQDWPLEVIGRDGKAINITMEPGDMVLYESHTIIHGRPFPLQGKYYANVFIHFEPTGRSLKDIDNDDMIYGKPGNPASFEGQVKLPPYMIPGSPEAKYLKQTQMPEDDDDWWQDWDSSEDDEEDDVEEEADEEDEEADEDDEWEGEEQSEEAEENNNSSEDEDDNDEEEWEGEEQSEEAFEHNNNNNNNNPNCPNNMDPSMAPAECLQEFAADQQHQQKQAVA